MAHLVFHIHRALTVLEQEGSERMAKVMKAHLPTPAPFNNRKNRSRTQF